MGGMNLFEQVGKFVDEGLTGLMSQVGAGLTGLMSQSISPEEEMDQAISQIRSTIAATQAAIKEVPPNQARVLKEGLAVLETELSEAIAKRNALLSRLNSADNKMQVATKPVRNPFERMEEKVREAEEAAEVAHSLVQQQNASNADLDQRFDRLGRDYQLTFEILKRIIVEQLEVDSDTVTLEAHFVNDLNVDEPNGVELIKAVEGRFEIEIPGDAIKSITTVQHAVDYVFTRS
jgi:acyl carrier protein